jgi:hypothetical protein
LLQIYQPKNSVFCKNHRRFWTFKPGYQNNSWWDRVGGPESVEKSQKSFQLAENQKK